MNRTKKQIWRFIPSGDLFYIEKKGRRYHISLKVISRAEAGRVFRGEGPAPKVEREPLSVSAVRGFEPVAENDFISL